MRKCSIQDQHVLHLWNFELNEPQKRWKFAIMIYAGDILKKLPEKVPLDHDKEELSIEDPNKCFV